MSNRKLGRPGKLTPEIQAEIVELVKAGNYIETACAVVGIGRSTYYDWLKKAKESTRSNRYTEFRDAVEKAQAWAEARDVTIITRHAENIWQAAAWVLERKYPGRWGRKRHKKKEKVSDKPVVSPVYVKREHVPPEDRVFHEKTLSSEDGEAEGSEDLKPGGEEMDMESYSNRIFGF